MWKLSSLATPKSGTWTQSDKRNKEIRIGVRRRRLETAVDVERESITNLLASHFELRVSWGES